MDYSRFGKPSDEWLAVQATLPETAAPSSLEEIIAFRDKTNEGRETIAAAAMKSLSSQISTKDFTITTRDGQCLQARSYRPFSAGEVVLPLYLHLHGGGHLFGTLDSEDAACARIALDAQVGVLNICYRHTPEHHYPTAWNDVEDAALWLENHVEDLACDRHKVVVGGISAGAWLAAALVLQTDRQDTLKFAGQVLMIPCLVHYDCYKAQLAKLASPEVSSYAQNRYAPVLPVQRAKMFLDLLEVHDPDEHDLRLNPGNAPPDQIRHLPPTVFGIAGLDILRDEGLFYAEKLHDAGCVLPC